MKIDRKSIEYAQGGLVLGSETRGMLGRAVQKDIRDHRSRNLMRGGVAPERWESPTLPRFFWPVRPTGPHGIHDQRKTNQCTGRSVAYVVASDPFPHIHHGASARLTPEEMAILYYETAKPLDPWPKNDKIDEGSTVRAAAKGLVALGEIRRYRWGHSIEDLRRGIRWLSMCVVGVDWTTEMFKPDREGLIRPKGGVDGGHAIAVCGYDDAKFGGAFQLPNSWGPAWGLRGFCWITYDDMALLLGRDGEACAYVKYETDEERGHP